MDSSFKEVQESCIVHLEFYITSYLNRKYKTDYQDDLKTAENQFEFACQPLQKDAVYGKILELETNEVKSIKNELIQTINEMNMRVSDIDKYNFTLDKRNEYGRNKRNDEISPIKRQFYNQLEKDICPHINSKSVIYKKIEDIEEKLKELESKRISLISQSTMHESFD